MLRFLLFLFLFTFYIEEINAQNVGINTDGSNPESGVMLDVKTNTAKATTSAAATHFQLKSNDADADALKMRFGLKTDATAGSRYGYLDVADLSSGTPTYRPLLLQPSAGQVAIGTTSPATGYQLSILAHGSSTLSNGINIQMTSPSGNANAINVSAASQQARGYFYSNSTTGTSNPVWGVGAELTNTNIVSGYNAYRNSSGLSYGLYGINGTNSTYATNVNTWAAFIQGRAVISSESSPSSPLGVDLEIRNTSTGSGNPATLSMRQTTSETTTGRVLGQLNIGDNHTTAAQARISVIRDAAGGSGDLPTAITFSTTTDGTSTLLERMRINNAGNIRIGVTASPTEALPSSTDNQKIRMDVIGGYLRVGGFNTDPAVETYGPGRAWDGSVGALAIGMNRNAGYSSVDFWNVTAHDNIAGANLNHHRGFDFWRYGQSGSEELVMSIMGNGLLTLTANNASSEGGQIILNNAGSKVAGSEANAWSIDNHNAASSAHTLRFYYNANVTSAILAPAHADGAAKVGINLSTTSNLVSTLHVGGDIAANSGFRVKPGVFGSFGGNVFNIDWTSPSAQLWIDATNIGSFVLTSDRRLKENIKPIDYSAIEKVKQLKPVTFKYKDIPGDIFKSDGVTYEGFIADELQEVIPSAVFGKKDALTSKGTIQPQTLNLSPIISVLTKAIQEQQEIIDQQNKRIEALERLIRNKG